MGPLVGKIWRSILAIDFEYQALPGEWPRLICCSALDLVSGQRWRIWLWDQPKAVPPFRLDADTLVLAYFATAEMGCFEVLGWPVPSNLIDLYAEQRVATNGLLFQGGRGLLDALRFYDLPHSVDEAEKTQMRDLAIRGGPYTPDEAQALQDYCDTDVDALANLWPVMEPRIDQPRALMRGQYIAAVARMEHLGVPVDVDRHQLLVDNWDQVRQRVALLASGYFERVYDGTYFRTDRFERYLKRRNLPWPRLANGRLKLDQDTWSDMARIHSQLEPLHQARKTLLIHSLQEPDGQGGMRPNFSVGRDGRNRSILGPFSSKTGRTQPSTKRFILSSAKWLRGGLIRPEPGRALAYVDWKSAELGIMASLSGNQAMLAAYNSGDPYLHFAYLAGRVPFGAAKADHKEVRERFKVVMLAVGYGQTAPSLGAALGIQPAYASEMLQLHRRTFPDFWTWSESVSATAHGQRLLRTRLGWPLHIIGQDSNDRSIRNFPVQATGGEIMRVAAVLAHQRGIRVLATLHDAFLIEAEQELIQGEILRMQTAMADASRTLLDGFELFTDVHGPIYFPTRFDVPEEPGMWTDVMQLLGVEP